MWLYLTVITSLKNNVKSTNKINQMQSEDRIKYQSKEQNTN